MTLIMNSIPRDLHSEIDLAAIDDDFAIWDEWGRRRDEDEDFDEDDPFFLAQSLSRLRAILAEDVATLTGLERKLPRREVYEIEPSAESDP